MKLLFTEHHLAHAASAFFPSGFSDAAVLTIDGVGEWATASVCRASGNSIEILKEMHFPHSLGLLYSAFTQFLGFRVNSGEYKLMGLAPYGQQGSRETQMFIEIIKKHLVQIFDDGSLKLNTRMFYFETGMKMIREKNWEKLFGFKTRLPADEIEQHHCNLAFAIQHITNEVVLKMSHTARALTGSDHLCLA